MSITNLPVEHIPVSKIVVGERRRQKLKGIGSLARSIKEHGLIHPILLRNGFELVAGQRRLEAVKKLGLKTIAVRHADKMTDAELDAIELEENTERDGLGDYEASKSRLAQIHAARAARKQTAEGALNQGTTPKKRPHRKTGKPAHRPKGTTKATSREAVAEETGVDPKTQREVEEHVRLAEAFPFLQRLGWTKDSTLKAGKLIEQLTASERLIVAGMLDQDFIPVGECLAILKNLADGSPAYVQKVLTLAVSDNPMDRRAAVTMAQKNAAPLDVAENMLGEARATLEKAVRKSEVPFYRDRLSLVVTQLKELESEFEEYRKGKYATEEA